MQPPTLQDILDARPRVYAHMAPSPLRNYPLIDEWIGCRTWVKHENHNPTGAFKVRGGINLISQFSDEERRRGVITASTGNHGQSIAYASRLFGVPCTVVVPVGNNPEKNASMRAMGATVIEHGKDFDEAREYVEERVTREGVRYVHPTDEPALIAGVATYALEIVEELPDPDYVFVAIGGGTGSSGCSIVRAARSPRTKIIGVQASRADAFAQSWRGPERVTTPTADTLAEGIATRVTFDLPFSILKEGLDDVVTVEEAELEESIRVGLAVTHNLVEGAGAASLAGARKFGCPADARIACVMSGGNLDARLLKRVLGGP
jgi:threonine dehydratase